MASRFIRFGATLLAVLMAAPAGAQLIISEFRQRGVGGDNDEFIEIHNSSPIPHTVAGGGGGYAVVASDGAVRGVIPNGVVIPGKGHYLLANPAAYSLSNYPAGPNATALADNVYFTDIPNNAGIAIFNTNVPADFTLANRLDAVGPSSEANPLYREGSGYPPITPLNINYAMVRDACGKSGSITAFGPCAAGGAYVDTDDNSTDFVFVDALGASAGAGQRLGPPGPQNLGSPVSNGGTSAQRLDTCILERLAPNRVRDPTMDPTNNNTWGTIDIRHTFTNTSAANITRLRFRIVDLTTFPAPWGTADLRSRTAPSITVTVDRPPCGSGTSDIVVSGTTLEQPPLQSNGGGFNGSLSVDAVTPITPLAPGASVDVRFLLGVQQTGNYKIGLVPEGSPSAGDGQVLMLVGCIDSCASVTSITRASANPTNASDVSFTVNFSTAVEGVDSTDFVVATTGTLAGAAVTSVTGTGSSRTVTVDTGSGDGVLRLHLIDDGSIGAVGGVPPLGGNFTSGEPYDLDRTGPSATVEQAGSQADPTGTSPVRFTVTFNESVVDFDGADVTLGGDAGATVADISSGFDWTYTVAVSGMTGPGTVTASIPAGVVSDVIGNTNAASTSTDNSVDFATVPAAPTSLSAVSGEGRATLTFVLPTDDDGTPILGYTAVCESASGTVEADGGGSPLLVTGLTNGVHYDCTVLAYNGVGAGPPSNSAAVFPQSVPLAPVILAVFEGDAQAQIHFAPPPSDGGSAILHYEVICSDGAATIDATGTDSPILVTGLVNHTTYSCVVLAHNAFGDGPPSAALSVRPPDNLLHEDGFEAVEAP